MKGLQFNTESGLAKVPFSALILLVLVAPALAWAAGPTTRGTVPQSSYQNGLVNVPNPLDQSGNLPITGNVQAGKHFRGSIPYRSTTSFGAPLGSTSLDPFLRYSASPEGQSNDLQGYSPFYSATRTVTTTSPGYQGVFTGASPKIAGSSTQLPTGRLNDTLSAAEAPQLSGSMSDLSASGSSLSWQPSRLPSWSTPVGLGDATDTLAEETGKLSVARPSGALDDPLMTSDEYQRRLQLLLQDLDKARENASQIEQKLSADKTEPAQQPTDQVVPAVSEAAGLQLYDPSTRLENNVPLPSAQIGEVRPSVMDSRDDLNAGPSSLAATLQRVSEYASRLQTGSANNPPARDRNRVRAEQEPIPAAPMQQAPTQSPPQTYENAGLATQQQFDQYLATAERYMRRGQYDRAVESFNLAAAYLPHDSRGHLGRSYSLLALGDYVNSAASLARAIELNAQLALKRVDLVETIGGPDLFVERIANLENLAERDNQASFQFLLAYVYYQMDRPNEAKTALQVARQAAMFSVAGGRLGAVIGR